MKIGCLAKIFVLLLNDGKTVKKVKSFKCGFKKWNKFYAKFRNTQVPKRLCSTPSLVLLIFLYVSSGFRRIIFQIIDISDFPIENPIKDGRKYPVHITIILKSMKLYQNNITKLNKIKIYAIILHRLALINNCFFFSILITTP